MVRHFCRANPYLEHHPLDEKFEFKHFLRSTRVEARFLQIASHA
jgi:hypothetical protein